MYEINIQRSKIKENSIETAGLEPAVGFAVGTRKQTVTSSNPFGTLEFLFEFYFLYK